MEKKRGKSIKKACDAIVLDMDAASRASGEKGRGEYADALLTVSPSVVLPLVACAVFAALGKPPAALAAGLSALILLPLTLILRRRGRLRRFYSVPEAHTLVDLKEGGAELDRLCAISPTLLFPARPEPEVLDLFYNWLCRRALVAPGERVEAFHVTGVELEGRLDAQLTPGFECLLFPLEGREPDDRLKYAAEARVLRLSLLEDVLKKDEAAKEKEREELRLEEERMARQSADAVRRAGGEGSEEQRRKRLKKYCAGLVMRLNAARRMTKAERRRDLAFALLICALALLVPIAAGAALAAKGKGLAAVLVGLGSIALALGIGLLNRLRILRGFYSVPRGRELFDIREGEPPDGPALLFPGTPEPELLDLYYNWLCRRALTEPGERVGLYRAEEAGFESLLLPLEGRGSADAPDFGEELRILGLRLVGGGRG